MKFIVGWIFLSLVYGCTSSDQAAAKGSNNSVNDLDSTEHICADSAVSEQSQATIYPLVNTEFYSLIPDEAILASTFSEGLEILDVSTQELKSPGNGVVYQKDSNHIQLRYCYYENAKLATYTLSLHSVISQFEIGDTLLTGEVIGHAKQLGNSYQFAADSWSNSPFGEGKWPIKSLVTKSGFEDPHRINNLIVVHKSNYHFYYFIKGQLLHDFEIALGQDPSGHKKVQGDNKTPEGRYLIVEKMKGPFDSPTGPWLGDSWFRLNYPNKWDAKIGYKDGLITKAQLEQIERAYDQKRDTPNNTKLGGHIGIHGWNGDWYQYGSHDITWGCVSMMNHQIDDIYDEIPVGTVVYIMP